MEVGEGEDETKVREMALSRAVGFVVDIASRTEQCIGSRRRERSMRRRKSG